MTGATLRLFPKVELQKSSAPNHPIVAVFEESAAISGLHSRRHEVELRLRAAEQNLTRLNDSLNDMRSRMASLKRQARQAERYKERKVIQFVDLILPLNWSEWSKIHQKIKQTVKTSSFNETVQNALQETKTLTSKVEELEKTLPESQKEVMEAQAVLQNFRVSLERLEQDIQTKTKGLQDAIEAKAQIEKDNDFTSDQYDQITTDLETAKTELTSIIENSESLPEQITAAEDTLYHTNCYNDLLTERQELETAIAVAK